MVPPGGFFFVFSIFFVIFFFCFPKVLPVVSKAFPSTLVILSTAFEALPLRPFQLPLTLSHLPLGPSLPQISLRPFQLTRRLSFTESEAPFDAFSLSFLAVILPCFVSIFRLNHTVLSNCVCFNTFSKRIEQERPTVSQIKDNFKRYPRN